MSETVVRILPEWDVVTGRWQVDVATRPGLGGIHGETQEEFNVNLAAALEGNCILIEHRGGLIKMDLRAA